jgi:outer membrane murein-binding lipoprotein Lpp
MQIRILLGIGLVAAALVLGGCQSQGGAQNLDDLRAKIAQLEKEVQDLKAQLAQSGKGSSSTPIPKCSKILHTMC